MYFHNSILLSSRYSENEFLSYIMFCIARAILKTINKHKGAKITSHDATAQNINRSHIDKVGRYGTPRCYMTN